MTAIAASEEEEEEEEEEGDLDEWGGDAWGKRSPVLRRDLMAPSLQGGHRRSAAARPSTGKDGRRKNKEFEFVMMQQVR